MTTTATDRATLTVATSDAFGPGVLNSMKKSLDARLRGTGYRSELWNHPAEGRTVLSIEATGCAGPLDRFDLISIVRLLVLR